MSRALGRYKNGNYEVIILDDGTKIRRTHEDEFKPAFAESMDMMITSKCDGGCQYCYAGCTPDGKHCDFSQYKELLDSIHPYTELAINGNDLSHPDLEYFLSRMKDRNVIVNMTVNQRHYMEHTYQLGYLIDQGYIHGLGVSLVDTDDGFLQRLTIPNCNCSAMNYSNTVVHVINGVVTPEQIEELADKHLKILILGYKLLGRGDNYYNQHKAEIEANQKWLKENLTSLYDRFDVVSFDNLALEQLDVKSTLTKEEWDSFFMGNDAEYTFYVDLVKGTFAESSLSAESYPIDNCSNIDDLFKKVCKKQ